MPSTTVETIHESHVDERIARLEDRLAAEQAQVPEYLVHEWVRDASDRFADARVRTFVPILVEREVRSRLEAAGRSHHTETVTGSLLTWARHTAHRLLAAELPRRWAHTQGVARRAAEAARVLDPEERDTLIATAWLHDIGYAEEVIDTGFHQLDGARYLAARGVPHRVCALVAHHAGAAAVAELTGLAAELAEFPDEQTAMRDAVWYADMTTSPDGEPVSFADRMRELRARRGPYDPVVRALTLNGDERAAAVRRTEDRLRHVALVRA